MSIQPETFDVDRSNEQTLKRDFNEIMEWVEQGQAIAVPCANGEVVFDKTLEFNKFVEALVFHEVG